MNNKRTLWLSLGLSQLLFFALLPVWLKLLAYLHPVVLPVVWICVSLLVFFVVFFVRKETIQLPISIIKIAVGVYSLGLFVLLFFRPENQEITRINYIPFRTIVDFLMGTGNYLVAFYNLAANILLFVPYGVAALLLYKEISWKQLLIVSAVVIFLIETAQHLTKRGTMDIDDLLLNLLGVGIGYLIYPVVEKVVKVKI